MQVHLHAGSDADSEWSVANAIADSFAAHFKRLKSCFNAQMEFNLVIKEVENAAYASIKSQSKQFVQHLCLFYGCFLFLGTDLSQQISSHYLLPTTKKNFNCTLNQTWANL